MVLCTKMSFSRSIRRTSSFFFVTGERTKCLEMETVASGSAGGEARPSFPFPLPLFLFIISIYSASRLQNRKFITSWDKITCNQR